MLLRKVTTATVGLLVMALWFWMPACATLTRAGEDVAVTEEETVVEDLVLFGSSASVGGYVESDVIAFAKSIDVLGTINQDLMGAAETIELTGQVGDDMRVGARYLNVRGLVGDDLIAFCQRLTLSENGRVGGEAQAWCQQAEFNGDVDGNLRIGCESAHIRGHVGGNLSVDAHSINVAGAVDGDANLKAEAITLMPGAIIAGNLKYTSANQIELQEGARVLGETNWHRPEVEEKPSRKAVLEGLGALKLFLNLAMLVGQIVVGLFLIGLSRKHATRIANSLTGHPWKSLGLGFVLAIFVPIASLILMLTIIGLPLGIIALLLYLIAWYLSPVVVGLTLGGKIVGAFKKDRAGPMIGGLILGLIILRAISLVPGLGWLFMFLVILFGLGALALSKQQALAEAKEKGVA
jgi:cytoskeletal protein CcmA (bactofilin family)